jgi:hypothetical protein
LRRRWLVHFTFALAVGAAAAAIVVLATRLAGWDPARVEVVRRAGALVAAGLALAWAFRFVDRAAAAAAIEKVRPSCRNLVVTAEELERHADRATPVVTARVLADAGRAVAGLRAADVVPLRWAFAAIVIAVGTALATTPRGQATMREALTAVARTVPGRGAASTLVRVTVEPPAYSGRASAVLTDPARIEVLEGSRIRFELPRPWRVRLGKAEPSADFLARDNGYFAVENAADSTRRLIPLSVTRDRAPTIRIETPARDLLLPSGNRTIPISISASDDLGLRELELRFTKVTGAGEQFDFVEGGVPVTIRRASERQWTADARLALASLQLGPGDSLVYRAVARDRRPGDAGLAASDTYFVEIAGPGQVPLEGIDMPPELDRHAMSQQMIVMKLERLRARESTMAKEAVTEEATGLAAEQRTVRANFIFLLGGHVEDEEVEAEQSHEIQEGRLENTARKDISTAISHMTRAEQGLTAVDTATALPPARAAVDALQRAFGRSRYLLRALAVRGRLDPSRRLTGDLEEAANWRRVSPDPGAREGEAARQLLARLLDAAGRATRAGGLDAAQAQELAEAALAIDPSSAAWQDISRQLADARDGQAVRTVVGRVSPEALQGALPRTAIAAGTDSPVKRAFRSEAQR